MHINDCFYGVNKSLTCSMTVLNETKQEARKAQQETKNVLQGNVFSQNRLANCKEETVKQIKEEVN